MQRTGIESEGRMQENEIKSRRKWERRYSRKRRVGTPLYNFFPNLERKDRGTK